MDNALKQLGPMERTGTLAERAREQLRATIMAGGFEPGAKLTIRSVARSLDISLTPAREALYSLVSEGALDMGMNGTVFVPVLTEERVRELLTIRLALEGTAAREAAPRMTLGQIAAARAANDQLLEANQERDYRRVMQLNWQFHFEIYRATGMPMLTRLIETCWLKTGSYLNLLYPAYGQTDRGIHIHGEMIEAVEVRDADRLSHVLQEDITASGEALIEVIRNLQKDADMAVAPMPRS
ncbi:GntR family transcriptional regulator [Roseospira marina]|uniref:GntR family transcriptional regulator n=1 Tax=Roseospira marina TaxID=140057 RepID=UPI0014788C8D|nr:GntR family transcriptional regulator [Roseospira marina]MBB4312345.1 DNA-binding GntR family transcriptional regulator [Roseospira marina]MBB5085639.1 DNA-binding GntR family transcriptional regulator [Roseospira marina]